MWVYFISFCKHGTFSAPYLGPNYDCLNIAVGRNKNCDGRFWQAGRSLLTSGLGHCRVHQQAFINTRILQKQIKEGLAPLN
jgi:hypothetical protein